MASYIWIVKWERFQHYKPERDQAPVWIKTYTKQHDDDNYRALTNGQRAVLHDLRIGFARARGRLVNEPLGLCRRFNSRVTRDTLEALNDAGFIEFISIETLETRLDALYAREVLRTSKSGLESRHKAGSSPRKKSASRVCPECGTGGGLHVFDCPLVTAGVGDE